MFQGFSEESTLFLKALRENNNRTWFEAHKAEYLQYLQQPMFALVEALTPCMLSIDSLMEIQPKKALSRIHRDVRFSHDKSPYRSNLWISFKRQYLDWKVEPVYFFELMPDYYRYGMGYYAIPREILQVIRENIDRSDKAFMKIHRHYANQDIFRLEGAKYKRLINPSLPEDLQDWYQRKELYFVVDRQDETLYRPELCEVLIEGFRVLEPLYHYFIGLKQEVVKNDLYHW